ncbi:MAG: hypothetical protein KZQ62_03890 [Candidatus Thiodiazotropha sp. (ex Lucinoma aequizonata)]|nr:hypothetical protein [Candidatus Thiodiazotropha sp. (ex Lucinoma aequizonata)]
MTAYCAPTVLRTSRFRIALPQQLLSFLMRRQEKIAPVLIMRPDITKRGSTGSLKK